jgi:hypothetical protein
VLFSPFQQDSQKIDRTTSPYSPVVGVETQILPCAARQKTVPSGLEKAQKRYPGIWEGDEVLK